MSIRKRTWQAGGEERTAWVTDYRDQHGKRRLKTFAKKKDAEAYRIEAGHEISRGTHTPLSESMTVAKAGELWLDQGRIDGLERSTLRQYEQHLELHIAPLLGAVRLAELSLPMVTQFENRLRQEGRSRAMTRKVVQSLGTLIAVAQDHGRVARNVVRDRPRKKRGGGGSRRKTQIEIPSKDEIRAMLDKAEGWFRPIFVTALFTGLRASELRGLTWDDIDFDKRVIQVRRRADRWNAMGPPKSDAGQRSIPLAPIVVNTLKEWKIACPKGELDLVFPNGRGNIENLANIYARGFAPLQIVTGVTRETVDGEGETILKARFGLHALRHAAASLFIESGMTPKKVQSIMGHASIQMTFDVYGHLFKTPEDDHAAMAQIQARLIG